MTTVSELVLTRNQLLEIVRRHEDSDFKVPLQRLSNVTAELQEGVMKTRMQPIGNAWQKLPRVVRDLCAELGKDIDLEMHGAETELDRQVLELVKDPLTHLVRNCADHGIESAGPTRCGGQARNGNDPAHRLPSGRPHHHRDRRRRPRPRCRAHPGQGDRAAGLPAKPSLPPSPMRKSAISSSLRASPPPRASPAFPAAASAWMWCAANIEQIGGTVDLQSVPGAGTKFTIKIPLTLAIVSALIVESGGERFAIPQISVLELVRASSGGEHRIEHIKDAPVLRLRNKLLPLHSSQERVAARRVPTAQDGFVVVTQVGSQIFGIVVDSVFHTEEIVIKPMSSKLRHIAAFSGTTILGDGSVIMIIDPKGIAQALGRVAQSARDDGPDRDDREEAWADDVVSLLVFRAGSHQPKAVPLSLVTRLEEIDCRKIEISDGRHLVQYRNQLMPLLRIDTQSDLKQEGAQPILVFSDRGRSMGLVVDEIVDIVEDRLNIEVASEQPGVLGYAVVKGNATEIIDIGHFLPQAFADWFRRRELSTDQLQRTSAPGR